MEFPWAKIFGYLPYNELLKCESVCIAWYYMIEGMHPPKTMGALLEKLFIDNNIAQVAEFLRCGYFEGIYHKIFKYAIRYERRAVLRDIIIFCSRRDADFYISWEHIFGYMAKLGCYNSSDYWTFWVGDGHWFEVCVNELAIKCGLVDLVSRYRHIVLKYNPAHIINLDRSRCMFQRHAVDYRVIEEILEEGGLNPMWLFLKLPANFINMDRNRLSRAIGRGGRPGAVLFFEVGPTVHNYNIKLNYVEIARGAAASGHLKFLKWFLRNPQRPIGLKSDLFIIAAENGHAELMKWIHDEWPGIITIYAKLRLQKIIAKSSPDYGTKLMILIGEELLLT